MPRSSKGIPHRAGVILRAWSSCRPTKRYSGLTLEQFRQAMQPCLDIREVIRDLKGQLRAAFECRRQLDITAGRVQRRIVYSVRGDPEDGEDSAIYAGLGFVPKSARRRRRSRRGGKKAKHAVR